MNSIGKKIKEARINAKLTEKQLAKKCGVAESFIVQVESGRKVINEKTAENILKKLGAKLESILQEDLKEEKQERAKPVKQTTRPTVEFNPVEPTGQWADALANVIKKYPIYDIATGNSVGQKNLPVLEKKVEGYRWDKLMFVKYNDTGLEGLRIHKNDIVQVYLTNDIQNNGVYLLEIGNKKVIRQLQKESSKLYLSTSSKEEPTTTDISKVKLIGRCVKVEYEI